MPNNGMSHCQRETERELKNVKWRRRWKHCAKHQYCHYKKKKCEEEDFKSGNGEEECVCRFFIVDMDSYGGFGFKRS